MKLIEKCGGRQESCRKCGSIFAIYIEDITTRLGRRYYDFDTPPSMSYVYVISEWRCPVCQEVNDVDFSTLPTDWTNSLPVRDGITQSVKDEFLREFVRDWLHRKREALQSWRDDFRGKLFCNSYARNSIRAMEEGIIRGEEFLRTGDYTP